jgi:endoglucanase Acf2
MRSTDPEKSVFVAYTINNLVTFLPIDLSKDPLMIQSDLKHLERHAIQMIHSIQAEQEVKENGYYISDNIIYKVYCDNTIVKKITGDEAKSIKRLINKYR